MRCLARRALGGAVYVEGAGGTDRKSAGEVLKTGLIFCCLQLDGVKESGKIRGQRNPLEYSKNVIHILLLV